MDINATCGNCSYWHDIVNNNKMDPELGRCDCDSVDYTPDKPACELFKSKSTDSPET